MAQCLGNVAVSAAFVFMGLALHGCGGGTNKPPTHCEQGNLTCRINAACEEQKCNNFNITSKKVAIDCLNCVGNETAKDAQELCVNKDKIEGCVACITKTSVTCWANP